MGTTRMRGSTALTWAVGVVLLALVALAGSPSWAPGGSRSDAAVDVITAGTQLSAMSTLPRPAVRCPEHLPRAHPGDRPGCEPERQWGGAPAHDGPAIRDPQRQGHRLADSRSPPGA
jgi:hypothetical protein